MRADNGRGSVSAGLNIRVAHILRAKQDKHDCVALRHKRLEGVLAHRRLRGGGGRGGSTVSVSSSSFCTRYLIILDKSFVLYLCHLQSFHPEAGS